MSVASIDELRATLSADDIDAVSTVDAIYSFLLAVGLTPAELRPLFRLEGALQDHARGKPHPLIAVNPRGGNRAHTADDMFKACVVSTMVVLMRGGEVKAAAADRIAARLKSAEIDVAPATIRTWYKEITTGRHADQGVVSEYRTMRRHFLSTPDHRAAAESLLEVLPTLMREKV